MSENIEEIKSFELTDSDINEVVQLTEYTGGGLAPYRDNLMAIAEYNQIDLKLINKELSVKVKNFVNKVTKFVLEFNDETLQETQKEYLKQVAEFQVNDLLDLLYLQEINKQMINNVVERINATSAEDYAALASYNNMVTQHLKLMKEVQSQYRNVPTVIKKMRADILCNQTLQSPKNPDSEVITSSFGDTQFNNHKQMLKAILEKGSTQEPQA
jgi:hypothetical protein